MLDTHGHLLLQVIEIQNHNTTNMQNSFVFLADGFEEIEALTCIDVMRRAGMPVVTVSIMERPTVTGAHGVQVLADSMLADNDYDTAEWLICPGGMPGATHLAECKPLGDALTAHNARGGKVAAICASPAVVLAPLGILNDRNAVCYPGMEADNPDINWGVMDVSIDGNIITGNGPAAANPFALAIVSHSLGEDAARQVADGMLLYEGEHRFYFK